MNEEKISPPGITSPETPSGTPQPSDGGLQQMAKEGARNLFECFLLASSAHNDMP